MDLTYLVVAVFGMCVARPLPAAAAPTPSEEPSLQVAAAAEPADNSKRSRSLFQPPPSPHQYHRRLQDGGIDLYGEVMDDLPTYLQQQYQQLQQQMQESAAGDGDGDGLRTDDDDDVDQDLRMSSRARPGNKPDSPVYFIRLPPQPYVYVPGYGYVSQPTRLEPPPFTQQQHSPFLNIPLSYVSNAKPVGVYTLPQQQQHPFQYQQQQQFSGRPKPFKRPQLPPAATTPPPPQHRPDSPIYNLDKGPYVFNGRPTDVFLLQNAYDNLYSEVLQNIYP